MNAKFFIINYVRENLSERFTDKSLWYDLQKSIVEAKSAYAELLKSHTFSYNQSMRVFCENNNTAYDTIEDASKSTGVTPTLIRRAILTKHAVRGYKFKEIKK